MPVEKSVFSRDQLQMIRKFSAYWHIEIEPDQVFISWYKIGCIVGFFGYECTGI